MAIKPWAGRSDAHGRVLDMLHRLAPTELEILITGPSGVGKELYARFAHEKSRRSARPFVGVNCGAIPADLIENELFGHVGGAFTGARARAEGLVAEAEGGTLFLDEVDALAPRNQVTLLRFIQEKEYRRLGEPRVRRADVRIIAASNCDLFVAAREGRFREDLLFRLRVAPIQIPPLRDRPEDIEEIWDQYRRYYASQYQLPAIELSERAHAAIRHHPWPGNVRELENCVRFLTCLQLARPIEPADLPFHATAPGANGHSGAASGANGKANGTSGIYLPGIAGAASGAGGHADFRSAKAAMVGEFERNLVQRALEDSKGNIAQAARSVGKPRRTFFALMRRHNISPRRMG